MKTLLKALLAMALGLTLPTVAHSRVFFGFNLGVPLYPPAYYYPPPVYYAPPVVVAPAHQPVYIEQAQPQNSAEGDNWWYYCPDSRTYYPYVRDCRSGWQRVPPRPAGP